MADKEAKYEQVGNKEVIYKSTTSTQANNKQLLKSENEADKTSCFLHFAAFSANLMAFSAGSIFSWTSPVLPKLNGRVDPHLNPLPIPLTPFEESWMACLVGLGALLGCPVAGKCADWIGRKKTLLLAALPMLLSVVLLAFAKTTYLFYLARFISGISVGVVFAVVPMYVGEIAEDCNRGALGCMMSLFIAIGILFSYAIGPFFTVKCFSLSLMIPLIIFLIIFGIFIPESPIYLISKGDIDGAEVSLNKLRNKPDKSIKVELVGLVKSAEDTKVNAGGLRDIFRSKGLTKGVVITSGLIFFQQTAGINIVLAFMENIFKAAGTAIPSSTAAIIVSVIQLVVVIITSAVVEKFGRKILLLISAAGSALSIFVLGIYFHLQHNGYDTEPLFWLPITSLIAYIIFFNVGLGPLPWAILGEMFPANVKSAASVLTSFTCFSSGFLITICHPYLSVCLGVADSFWLYAIFGASCFFFTYFYVIETRGKSLSEIQDFLNDVNKIPLHNI